MGVNCSCQGRLDKVGAISTRTTVGTSVLQRKVILTPNDESASEKLKVFYEQEKKFIPKKIDVYYQSIISNQAASVTSIVVKVSHLGPAGVEYLCRVLPFYPLLLELRLWKVGLDSSSVERLAYYLPFLKQLHVLSLEDNNLTDTAMEHVSRGLRSMKLLEQLWLGCNQMTAVGAASLASSLRLLGELTTLCLDYNFIESLGCSLLCTVLCETNRLSRLSLESCDISDDAIPHLTCLAQVNAPEHVTNLKGNRFTTKGVKTVQDLFGLERVDVNSQVS